MKVVRTRTPDGTTKLVFPSGLILLYGLRRDIHFNVMAGAGTERRWAAFALGRPFEAPNFERLAIPGSPPVPAAHDADHSRRSRAKGASATSIGRSCHVRASPNSPMFTSGPSLTGTRRIGVPFR